MIEVTVSEVNFLKGQFTISRGYNGRLSERACPLCATLSSSSLFSSVETRTNVGLAQYICAECEILYHRFLFTSEQFQQYYMDKWRVGNVSPNSSYLQRVKSFFKNSRLTSRAYEKTRVIAKGDSISSKELTLWAALSGLLYHPTYKQVFGRDLNIRRAIDFGCGEGFMLQKFASLGISCVGIDANNSRVAKVRSMGFEAYSPDQFGVVESRSDKVDLIISQHVFEHLFDPVHWIKRLSALLRKGGFLYIEVPQLEYNVFHTAHQFIHCQKFSIRSLTKLLELAGLKPLRLYSDLNLAILAQKIDIPHFASHSNALTDSSFGASQFEIFNTIPSLQGVPLSLKYTNGSYQIYSNQSLIHSSSVPYYFSEPYLYDYRFDFSFKLDGPAGRPCRFIYDTEYAPIWLE